jgi:hypothetical protein
MVFRCVGRVPSALLSPGAYNGVRTDLMQTSATHQSTIESHVISIILKLTFSNNIYIQSIYKT